MPSSKISKESIGLAGEYAVASELCKRGYYAQLTMGNHKKTDLLVETENTLFRVSVKAKQGSAWPKVSGISAKGDLIIFVDFEKKALNERPDFYVLNVAKWVTLAKSLQKTPRGAGSVIDKSNTHVWENWRGISIKKEDIKQHKDSWPKL